MVTYKLKEWATFFKWAVIAVLIGCWLDKASNTEILCGLIGGFMVYVLGREHGYEEGHRNGMWLEELKHRQSTPPPSVGSPPSRPEGVQATQAVEETDDTEEAYDLDETDETNRPERF
jgi:hypothetical protein